MCVCLLTPYVYLTMLCMCSARHCENIIHCVSYAYVESES